MGFFDFLKPVGVSQSQIKIDNSWNVKTRYSAEYYMCDMRAMYDVYGGEVKTRLEDNGYDFVDDVIWLSADVYTNNDVVSIATACHELGHEIAYKSGITCRGYQCEKIATEYALNYLVRVLDGKQFTAASDFLNAALETYKNK